MNLKQLKMRLTARLNSNIRCIEMILKREPNEAIPLLNSNIRCIEMSTFDSYIDGMVG